MTPELEKKVVQWAEEKGIFEHSAPHLQAEKTLEEFMELLHGINTDDRDEVIDAIGDIIVTLIIQAEMWGTSATKCLEVAYNIISKRKGSMVNGKFVKETDSE